MMRCSDQTLLKIPKKNTAKYPKNVTWITDTVDIMGYRVVSLVKYIGDTLGFNSRTQS